MSKVIEAITSCLFLRSKMSNFVPSKEHSRTVLLFLFHSKKTAAESHRMLVEIYGDNAPSHAEGGSNVSKVMILKWMTKNGQDRQKSFKTPNCKNCWMRIRAKLKNGWLRPWELHNKPFRFA